MPGQATPSLELRPAFRSSEEFSGTLSSQLKPRTRRLAQRTEIPRVSRVAIRWFTWYAELYLRRHFHTLGISKSGPLPLRDDMPLVLYANHASWWDPLVFLVIKRAYFPDRTFFAPIDSRMLERYSFFRKLGFFGVEPGTRRGAAQFLRTSEIVLGSPGGMLALTPQSRFADVRERPVRFASGLGYLAARLQNARFVPVAAEYVFWNERLPEILVRFGAGIETPANSGCGRDAQAWTGVLERGLQEAQEALSLEAQSRDPARFSPLLRGRAGQGGAYDWWRAAKAFLRGRTFNPEHGAHEP